MERLDNVDELIWRQTFAEQRRLLGSQYFSAISTPSLSAIILDSILPAVVRKDMQQ